ncbi:three-helix bundle dimerization domain-containing protein [Mycobacterium sp. BMJ-28]
MAGVSEELMIAAVTSRLIQKHPEFSPERVVEIIDENHRRFEASSIRDFVPLLVERRATAALAEKEPLSV